MLSAESFTQSATGKILCFNKEWRIKIAESYAHF